jgi:anti-sigma B factor antagonist
MRVGTYRGARLARFAHLNASTSPTTMLLPSLVIQVTSSDPLITRVELRGELDALTAGRCGEFLLALLDEHPPTIVLDLSELSFCDAGGLSTFVRLANRADALGGGVTLTGVRSLLARQLRVTGLDRRFPIPDPSNVRPMRRRPVPDS